jgi:secondary thiamine-phosphate synthase enzyme
MAVHGGKLQLQTGGDGEIVDLTEGVAAIVRTAGVVAGLATVFVAGTTAAVTTMEYEAGAVIDLREALERLAPQGHDYEHNRRNQDTNGHAHVRAAAVGPSVGVPIVAGGLALGVWQQIVLIDFDTRARERTVMVAIVG